MGGFTRLCTLEHGTERTRQRATGFPGNRSIKFTTHLGYRPNFPLRSLRARYVDTRV